MTCADYYKKNGYAVFRGSLPVAQVESREQEIIAPYDGPLPRHMWARMPSLLVRSTTSG